MVKSNVKPLRFIRVLQRSNGRIIDHHDEDQGEDQNIGLHDLVGQLVMRWTDMTQKITVLCRSASIKLDAGYCPFCPYYIGSHRTLNNHVWAHLRLSLFCGMLLHYSQLQGHGGTRCAGTQGRLSAVREVEQDDQDDPLTPEFWSSKLLQWHLPGLWVLKSSTGLWPELPVFPQSPG